MAGIIDNFQLGWAGLEDGAERLIGIHANHAAQVYAEQTSADAATQQQLVAAATAAEDRGALGQAAHDTANQVAAGVAKFSLNALTAIEWGLGIAAGVGLLYLGHKAVKAWA